MDGPPASTASEASEAEALRRSLKELQEEYEEFSQLSKDNEEELLKNVADLEERHAREKAKNEELRRDWEAAVQRTAGLEEECRRLGEEKKRLEQSEEKLEGTW